jgi:hypothetical protein
MLATAGGQQVVSPLSKEGSAQLKYFRADEAVIMSNGMSWRFCYLAFLKGTSFAEFFTIRGRKKEAFY